MNPSRNPGSLTRRQFVKLAGAVLALGVTPTLAFESSFDQLRGDRVGWARLKTSSPHWMRHSGSDPVLMNFFRGQTTLNIDPAWYSADVNRLDELCKYPFLFSQGVGVVREPAARNNLAEYVRRGGFLLVDAC